MHGSLKASDGDLYCATILMTMAGWGSLALLRESARLAVKRTRARKSSFLSSLRSPRAAQLRKLNWQIPSGERGRKKGRRESSRQSRVRSERRVVSIKSEGKKGGKIITHRLWTCHRVTGITRTFLVLAPVYLKARNRE